MFEGKTILYLEDEPIVALDTSMHLEDLKFAKVIVTHRLENARRAAADNDIDMAMLDINVDQGQTSIELGQHLHRNGVAVLFASGNSFDIPYDGDHVFAFLDKPFTFRALTRQLTHLAGAGAPNADNQDISPSPHVFSATR